MEIVMEIVPNKALSLSLSLSLSQSLQEKDNNLFSVLYGYFLATISDKLNVVPGCGTK